MSDNRPEPLGEELQGGDQTIGEELRTFFIGLLDGANLERYHLNRNDYINKWDCSDDTKEILRGGSLGAIEGHILAITGSSRAKPLMVVSPPY
jgi:hypothetical protein